MIKQDLSGISQLDTYLIRLGQIKKNVLIIISVKDTVGLNLTVSSANLIKKLGIETDLHGMHGHSYIAVIDRGAVLLDRLSESNETLEDHRITGGVNLFIKSSVYTKENVSLIAIENVDYSINLRGLNIVVYDYENGVKDTVCFDTHVKANTCYRTGDKLLKIVTQLSDQVMQLNRGITQIKQQIHNFQIISKTDHYKSQLLLWHAIRSAGETDLESRKRFFRALPPADGIIRKLQLAGLILLVQFDRICRAHNIQYWISFGTLLGAVRHGGFIPWDDDTDVGMMRNDILRLQEVIKDNPDYYVDEFFAVYNTAPGSMNHNYQVHFSKKDTPYSLDIFVYDYSENLNTHIIKELYNIKERLCSESLTLTQRDDKGARKEEKQYGEAFFKLFQKHYAEEQKLLGDSSTEKYMIWSIDNLIYGPAFRSSLPKEYVFPLSEIEFEGHIFMAPRNPELYTGILYNNIYTIPDDILSHAHFQLTDHQLTVLDEVLAERGDCL